MANIRHPSMLSALLITIRGLSTASALSNPSLNGAAASSTAAGSFASTQVRGARQLGNSDLVVSEACLGTMTFGVQNDRNDAFQQLNYARSFGVNFVDTAELYPVPVFAKKWKAGATEEIVGDYIEMIGPAERDELVIATKIAGYFPSSPVAAARTVPPTLDPMPDCRLDKASIRQAVDASLRRLKTDHIDLMQIHWPDRYIPVFGQTMFDHDSVRDDSVPIEETASALRDLIEEGKIRNIGLSNESTLGVCQWVHAMEKLGISNKLASIQNSYNLVDRRFDGELAEACSHFNIGLLPWSILAGGLLTGKYQKNAPKSARATKDSRFNAYPQYMTRWSPISASTATLNAVDEYTKIAAEAGMTAAELAIAFCRSRRFVSDSGSVIVGATTMEQLKQNLAPFENPVELDENVLEAINKVHLKCRDPCCSL